MWFSGSPLVRTFSMVNNRWTQIQPEWDTGLPTFGSPELKRSNWTFSCDPHEKDRALVAAEGGPLCGFLVHHLEESSKHIVQGWLLEWVGGWVGGWVSGWVDVCMKGGRN